jgi:hypothetical protein
MVMDADGKNATVVLSDKQTGKANYVGFVNPEWR